MNAVIFLSFISLIQRRKYSTGLYVVQQSAIHWHIPYCRERNRDRDERDVCVCVWVVHESQKRNLTPLIDFWARNVQKFVFFLFIIMLLHLLLLLLAIVYVVVVLSIDSLLYHFISFHSKYVYQNLKCNRVFFRNNKRYRWKSAFSLPLGGGIDPCKIEFYSSIKLIELSVGEWIGKFMKFDKENW